jgi:hypothetical protein
METIRQVVDGRILSKVISLPKPMQSIFVEVVITPTEKQSKPTMTRSQLKAKLKGSHTEVLSGALHSNGDMTLEGYRAERREKYERVN